MMRLWARHQGYELMDGILRPVGPAERYNPWKEPAHVELINLGRRLPFAPTWPFALTQTVLQEVRAWFVAHGPLYEGVVWELAKFCHHAAMFASTFINLQFDAGHPTAAANHSLLMLDVRPTIEFGLDGRYTRTWDCGSLLGMLAVMATEDLVNGVRLEQCENAKCARFFAAANDKQLYCSDACKHRQQARRHRQKIKTEKIEAILDRWGSNDE